MWYKPSQNWIDGDIQYKCVLAPSGDYRIEAIGCVAKDGQKINIGDQYTTLDNTLYTCSSTDDGLQLKEIKGMQKFQCYLMIFSLWIHADEAKKFSRDSPEI